MLEVGNVHVAFFSFFDRLAIFLPSRSVGFGKADEKGQNVAGATSGASSGPPTSPPLLFCCCRAAVAVLRSSCVSLRIPKLCNFTLELGAVHASSHKIYTSTAVWSHL